MTNKEAIEYAATHSFLALYEKGQENALKGKNLCPYDTESCGYGKGKADAIDEVIDSLNVMHDMAGLDNYTLDALIKSLMKIKEKKDD